MSNTGILILKRSEKVRVYLSVFWRRSELRENFSREVESMLKETRLPPAQLIDYSVKVKEGEPYTESTSRATLSIKLSAPSAG